MSRARTLLLALAAALVAALAALPPASAAPLRVVAFGDSLTMGQGSTHQAGYRLAFLQRMTAAGFEVDMLGRYRHGPEGMDADHEGYQGHGVAKIDEESFGAVRRYHPDAILLMIGTNDAHTSFQPDSFRIRFSVLLDCFLAESRVRLVVSTIPPGRFAKAKKHQVKAAVNKVIREEVEKQRAAGKRIRLVDAYALVDDHDDFVDTLHLNDGAYAKLGEAFADALLELLREYPPPAEGSGAAAAAASPDAGLGAEGDGGGAGSAGDGAP
jgi:lysophospholipase L1-like esterase